LLEVVGLVALTVAGLAVFALIVVLMADASDEPASVSPVSSLGVRGDVFAVADHDALPVEAGCEQLAYHAEMAMWSSALADDLLDFGCGFPIVPVALGESLPSVSRPLDVEFVPLRYQGLVGGFQRAGFEVCTEVRVAEEPGDGFVYGFVFHFRLVSCVSDAPEIEVVVREYATREHRDDAARRMAGRDGSLMPLAVGRWVVSFEDLDRSGSSDLTLARQVVLDLGGVPG
jgi:hypothetical protein